MAATLSSLFAFSKSFQRISTVLLWVLFLAHVDAQNRSAEIQTLLRFKSLTEAGTLLNGRWNTWKETDGAPCNWAGVKCTKTFTVQQLDFGAWGLQRLPGLGVLSSLTDLRELDLWRNTFKNDTGAAISIPDDIGSLVGLTHIDFTLCGFTGPLPRNISALRGLRYIMLSNNKFTGEIPDLSGMVDLEFLNLRKNQLSGPFPTWVGKLNSLQSLDLSMNMFNGTIPSLSGLANLLVVILSNNSFTGFEEPVFPGANNLERLSANLNQLEGPISPSITKLLSLKILDLSRNQLSGPIPSGFSLDMSEAILIDLSYNQLMGSIPESFLQPSAEAARNLPSLNISQNLLTGHIPFDGTKQYYYQVMDFSHNNLTGPLPSICKNGTSSVGQLSLQNNQLSGDIVEFLAECYAHMQYLQLAKNSFSGDLSRLENVNTTSDLVRRKSKLQTVDLSNNNLQISTSEGNPDPLRTVLEFFVLNTSIIEFRIQGNNFSGTPLPAYFSSSANLLSILDLSNNHLEGGISGAAFNDTWLPALQFLNLSNNDLSGPLPAELPYSLYNPSFFAGNSRLCGGPLRACPERRGLRWWIVLLVVAGSVVVAVGSCFVVIWRWRVYRKMHQQDADLLETLLERQSAAALMPLHELRKATSNFAESAQIGEGGFGTVYVGKLNDGTKVAIKRSKCVGSEKDKEKFLNEVRILSQISHRHLVKLLGCCMENGVALLVFEFVPNGTLQEHLEGEIGETRLSWKERLHIAVQTADALTYLHSSAEFPIFHRDVKSANILLDNDLNTKVADFGISRLAPIEATHVSTLAIQGTIGYLDPEYCTSFHLTDKSDVYSFGVVLLELITAKNAIDFRRSEEETSLVNFASRQIERGDLHELLDEALLETYNDLAGHGKESILNMGRLAMKCLHMRSKARPSMQEVWKELQRMWLELEQGRSTSTALDSISEDDNKDRGHDHTVNGRPSNSVSHNGSTFSPHDR